MRRWFDFCDYEGYFHLDHSKNTIHDYVTYLCYDAEVTSGTARQSLTALAFHFYKHRISWSRASDPILSKLLRGFDVKRPSAKRVKKPICLEILHAIRSQFDLNTYSGTVQWTALLTAYYFGLRCGEYAVSTQRDTEIIVTRSNLTFTRSKSNKSVLEAIINVPAHKGDRLRKRDAHVPVACNSDCTGSAHDDVFCPVHALRRYTKWRDRLFKKWQPLFMNKHNGLPLLMSHINNIIQTAVQIIDLDPKHYSSHGLRAGRATDLARARVLGREIKKWGRWVSDIWESFYLKLDLTDIARVTRTSLQDLRLANTNPAASSTNPRVLFQHVIGTTDSTKRRCGLCAATEGQYREWIREELESSKAASKKKRHKKRRHKKKRRRQQRRLKKRKQHRIRSPSPSPSPLPPLSLYRHNDLLSSPVLTTDDFTIDSDMSRTASSTSENIPPPLSPIYPPTSTSTPPRKKKHRATSSFVASDSSIDYRPTSDEGLPTFKPL